jgi:hypothetical protein
MVTILTEAFHGFAQSFKEILGYHDEAGHDHFLSNPFKSIVYSSIQFFINVHKSTVQEI